LPTHDIRAAPERQIGSYELLVAATALEPGSEVATFNRRHFELVFLGKAGNAFRDNQPPTKGSSMFKRTFVSSLIASALVSASAAQAGPTAGIYNVDPPGTWAELLLGGQAGQVGNEITAENEHYKFEGATIAKVEASTDPAWDWVTVYEGGVLTLANVRGAPWFSPCSPSEPMVIPYESVTVKTRSTRFTDGTLEFELSGRAHGVSIHATYSGKPTITPVEGDVLASGELDTARVAIAIIAVDVKPGSCPNPLNVKSQGVLPVAILGTSPSSIRGIDPKAVVLEYEGRYIRPLRSEYGYTMDCAGHVDRCPDLLLKFDTSAVVRILGPVVDREVVTLNVIAWHRDGLRVSGGDQVIILNPGNGPRNPPGRAKGY
jgi:hypothetical protein